MYLHHQWSDEAHTLQFCSTGEYFETVEYELHRTLGARDSWWFVSNSQVCSSPHTSPVGEFISNLGGIFNFRRIDLKTQKSDFLKNFFLIRVIVCILWKNLFGNDLSVLKSIKQKVSKKLPFFAESRGPPTWRAWLIDIIILNMIRVTTFAYQAFTPSAKTNSGRTHPGSRIQLALHSGAP